MAERHNIKQILTLARDLVCKVQMLIENKWLCCLSSFPSEQGVTGCSSTREECTLSHIHEAFTIILLLWALLTISLYVIRCCLCCQQVCENITLNICQYVEVKTNVKLFNFQIFLFFFSEIPQVSTLVRVHLIFSDKDGFSCTLQTKKQNWIQPETIFMGKIHCDNSLYWLFFVYKIELLKRYSYPLILTKERMSADF